MPRLPANPHSPRRVHAPPIRMDNLVAPLGHHWQDANTHQFWGATAGVFGLHWKLEGSAFNGGANEERWGSIVCDWNSYSGRFTMHMDSSWVVSAATASLESRSLESVGPCIASRRPYYTAGNWAGTVNRTAVIGEPTGILEGHAFVLPKRAVWIAQHDSGTRRARAKDARTGAAADLVDSLQTRRSRWPLCPSDTFARSLECRKRRSASDSSNVNLVPNRLQPFYGSRTPLGGMLFLRIRPLHGHMRCQARCGDARSGRVSG